MGLKKKIQLKYISTSIKIYFSPVRSLPKSDTNNIRVGQMTD